MLECACLFKCSLCQRDKEFDGFIRNTKALFSRVRRAPLGSTQSADKLEGKKKKKGEWGEECLNFPWLHVGWPGSWSCEVEWQCPRSAKGLQHSCSHSPLRPHCSPQLSQVLLFLPTLLHVIVLQLSWRVLLLGTRAFSACS